MSQVEKEQRQRAVRRKAQNIDDEDKLEGFGVMHEALTRTYLQERSLEQRRQRQFSVRRQSSCMAMVKRMIAQCVRCRLPPRSRVPVVTTNCHA
jgi:hypothetical protein